jgi:hypothetical protein
MSAVEPARIAEFRGKDPAGVYAVVFGQTIGDGYHYLSS